MRKIFQLDIITNVCFNPFIAEFIFRMFINSSMLKNSMSKILSDSQHFHICNTSSVLYWKGEFYGNYCIINILIKNKMLSFKHRMAIP